MDTPSDNQTEFNDIEYEVQVPSEDKDLPVTMKVKREFLQILVDKFGHDLPIREVGDEEWQPAWELGIRRQRIRKNLAIAEARIRNTFTKKKHSEEE